MTDRLNSSGLTFLRFDANKAKNAWRIWLEPRRLFWRYLTTDPRALYLLLNRCRHSNRTRG